MTWQEFLPIIRDLVQKNDDFEYMAAMAEQIEANRLAVEDLGKGIKDMLRTTKEVGLALKEILDAPA